MTATTTCWLAVPVDRPWRAELALVRPVLLRPITDVLFASHTGGPVPR
ncbi:hypothetical protein ABZ719_24440 [Streptomyces sp. NPDC006743]